MSYEKIANGALFKNNEVKGNGPEYSGPGELEDGTPVQFAAWVKEKNGRKYFSLAVTKKNEEPQQSGDRYPDDDGDAIPF